MKTDVAFDFIGVIGYASKTVWRNLGFFVGMTALVFGITMPLFIISGIVSNFDFPYSGTIHALTYFGGHLMMFILFFGVVRICLDFIEYGNSRISLLFSIGWLQFWKFLATNILYALIIYAGFLLLIIPGIIWTYKFMLAPYFVVDKQLGPIAALKASSRATKGSKLELFALSLLVSGVMILGYLCLLIGVLAAYPIMILSYTLVYRQLARQTQLQAIEEDTPELQKFE